MGWFKSLIRTIFIPKVYSFKKHFFILCCLCLLICYFINKLFLNYYTETRKERNLMNAKRNYLINTSTCKIPDLDPFNDEVKQYFQKEEYLQCTNLNLLTYIANIDGRAVLKINQTILKSAYFDYQNMQCCVSEITRRKITNNTDDLISISNCVPFSQQVVLKSNFIKVKCLHEYFGEVYTNVHATVLPTAKPKRQNTSYSILLIGIDSISKSNLIRTMPETYKFLERNFINLKGYTKVADNTFPNLMAILTGKSREQVYKECKPDTERLDHCDFIWKDLRRRGYVTAYAEDECTISTFNYDDWGFDQPPTDYYYRPYMLAAETLEVQKYYGMCYCTGPESSGQRILNAAKDFTVAFQHVPNFGLFWMNSFSHDNINLASSMDEKLAQFLRDISFNASLSNTLFVFFSDHGFRFGDFRYTHTGWLEERLPFIYIHLPVDFQARFPKEFTSFRANAENRLTTPYDLHLTLNHLVQIQNQNNYFVKSSDACPNCKSLFYEISENRTCKEAAIDQHWCTCKVHSYVAPTDAAVQAASTFVVDEINRQIRAFKEGNACAIYYLHKVVISGISEQYLNANNERSNYYLIIFETIPSAMFEATVEVTHSDRDKFELLGGDISRINRYSTNSKCVSNGALKKYCYCPGFVTALKSAICNIFDFCL